MIKLMKQHLEQEGSTGYYSHTYLVRILIQTYITPFNPYVQPGSINDAIAYEINLYIKDHHVAEGESFYHRGL